MARRDFVGRVILGILLSGVVASAAVTQESQILIPIELVDRVGERAPDLSKVIEFAISDGLASDHENRVRVLRVFPGKGIQIPGGLSYPLEIRVHQTGWWADPYLVTDQPTESPVTPWKVFRADTVTFPVDLWEKRDRLPDARAVFCGCPDRFGAPTKPCGEATVLVGETTYEIELPKGCVDLEIVTKEYAPVNVDGVLVGEKNDRRPTILLIRGGSVRGTVISSVDGLPVGAASILAKPLFASRKNLSPSVSTDEPVEVRYGGSESTDRFRTLSNVRGRFRLAGLEPGNYRFSFLKDDLAPLTLDSVEILEDSEVAIGWIEMGPGATVTAMILPGRCGTEPLEVALLRKMNEKSAMTEKTLPASPDGSVVFSNIAQGRYFLEVHGRCGAVQPRPMGMEAFSVNYGDDLFVSVDLDVCRVSGRISRDGDAVAGTVNCRKWGHNAGFQVATDDQGGFDAFLPGPGNYDFTVTGDGAKSSVSVKDLECSDFVEIEIPTSSISGTVTDENGNPVEGARIEGERQTDQEDGLRRAFRATAQSGSDGRFRLEGPEPGTWDVFATQEDRESGMVPVVIRDDDDAVENIALVLRDLRTIEFLSVDEISGIPVPGVGLTVSWDRGPGTPFVGEGRESLVTDFQGRAELRVSQGASNLQVVTISRGRPIAWGRFPAEETVTVSVPSGPGGFVELRRSEGQWLGMGLPVTVLRHNGSLMNPIKLAFQFGYGSINEGNSLVLGPLAKGTYDIIFVKTPEEVGQLMAGPAAFPTGVRVSVHAGETTPVDAPF